MKLFKDYLKFNQIFRVLVENATVRSKDHGSGWKISDRVRVYCDTTISQYPYEYAKRMQERLDKGYTSLKMDIGTNLLKVLHSLSPFRWY